MINNPFVAEPHPGKPRTPDRWMDGKITSTSPLMVQLAGYEEEPQPPTKPPLVGGLTVNDRVLCLLQGRQLIIIGRYGG